MADKTFFSRLRNLFNQNVIVRNVGGRKLKVDDTNNIQAFVTNAIRDRYSRIHAGTAYSQQGMGGYGVNMSYQSQRIMLFRDYDLMDNDPIIASALDVYADETTVKNEYGEILTIDTDNGEVKDILHNLFYDILNIEFNLWPWIRNLCKYGDFFLFLEIAEKYGIINVLPLSVYDTVRIEGEKPDNPSYVRFETLGMNGAKTSFENFEMAHFRLNGDANFMPYGKSMIEPSRRIFRQLSLMEDAMMIHRIMRAPEKRVFKVDVGSIPPNEIDSYMQRLMDRSKKVPFVDPTTGDYNLRYNMQNLLEDFYLPVRGSDSGTSIENLGGLEYNSIEDIEYLRNKEMASLKIPKAFLGYDSDVNGKATLAAEDVRFARTIERLQKTVVSELTKIAIIHLYAQGYNINEIDNFSLRLTNPSTIYEQEKVNLWTQKVGLILQMQQTKMFSDDFMYQEVFDMHNEEILEQRKKLVKDNKFRFRLTAIEGGQPDPAKFGYPQDQEGQDAMGGGGMPGGGGEAGGAPAPGGPEGGPAQGAVTSVDQLPTAAELGLEENEETRGRPRTGSVYAQDSHVRGRDPLGFKERYNAMQVGNKRTDKKKSALSLEIRQTLKGLAARTPKKLLEGASTDEGTILDEAKLLKDIE